MSPSCVGLNTRLGALKGVGGGGDFDVVVARGFQSQEIVTELQSEL